MTQAPLKGKLVCLTYFRGCWIICALLQGRYNSSLAINYLTMGCHQSACNFHCQVHSIFVYPWTHTFSSWQEEVFLYRISNELCVSSEIHYFTTYYSEISFATDQKRLKKTVIYSSLKTVFSMKVCYREQIEKNASYSAIFKNMSQQIVINLSDIATQFGIIY